MDRYRCRRCRGKSCTCTSSPGDPNGAAEDDAIASPRVSSTTCTPTSRSRDRRRRSPRRAAVEGRRRRESRPNSADRRWRPERSRSRSPLASRRLDADGRGRGASRRSRPSRSPEDSSRRRRRDERRRTPSQETLRVPARERLGVVPVPLMSLTGLSRPLQARLGSGRRPEHRWRGRQDDAHHVQREEAGRGRTSRLDRDATIHCSVRNDHFRRRQSPRSRTPPARSRTPARNRTSAWSRTPTRSRTPARSYTPSRSRTPPVRFRVTIGREFPSADPTKYIVADTRLQAESAAPSKTPRSRDVQIEPRERASSSSSGQIQSVIKKVNSAVQIQSVIERASSAVQIRSAIGTTAPPERKARPRTPPAPAPETPDPSPASVDSPALQPAAVGACPDALQIQPSVDRQYGPAHSQQPLLNPAVLQVPSISGAVQPLLNRPAVADPFQQLPVDRTHPLPFQGSSTAAPARPLYWTGAIAPAMPTPAAPFVRAPFQAAGPGVCAQYQHNRDFQAQPMLEQPRPRGWYPPKIPKRRRPSKYVRAAIRKNLTPTHGALGGAAAAAATAATAVVTTAAALVRSEMDAGAAAVKEQLRRNLARAAMAMGIASAPPAAPAVP